MLERHWSNSLSPECSQDPGYHTRRQIGTQGFNEVCNEVCLNTAHVDRLQLYTLIGDDFSKGLRYLIANKLKPNVQGE